jgi:small conductance mechanosensitive channel
MSVTETPTPTQTTTVTPFLEYKFLDVPISEIISIIIIAVVAIALERTITRYLTRLSKKVGVEPNTANNLALFTRIMILIFAVAALTRVVGYDSTWIVSISAIGAAAVGFASQKTIGNFIAGIFLLAAKPFKVGDYVKVGTVEGIVQEINLNYTIILTAANNTVSISNLQLLDRDVVNYGYENGKNNIDYCYTFELGFDHSIPVDVLNKIFDDISDRYSRILPKKPQYALMRSTFTERVYMIYLYVDKPQDIFTLRPRVSDEIFQRWDQERAKLKNN